jgi:ferredoxin
MAYEVVFEPGKCQGYANCLIEAPEIWDFSDSENRALLKLASPDERLRSKAEASARCCPAQAIRIEEASA